MEFSRGRCFLGLFRVGVIGCGAALALLLDSMDALSSETISHLTHTQSDMYVRSIVLASVDHSIVLTHIIISSCSKVSLYCFRETPNANNFEVNSIFSSSSSGISAVINW